MPIPKFQSLFSWNLLLMYTAAKHDEIGPCIVSILVFVELALDARFKVWRKNN